MQRSVLQRLAMQRLAINLVKMKGCLTMTTIKARLTFIEDILGTSPNDGDIYRQFIASKAPDASTIEEEVEAVGIDEVVEKGMTVFPRTPAGIPFLYDYQIKGFFKDTCSMLQRVSGKDEDGKKRKSVNESGKLTAHKKIIDGLIFVFPRKIPIHFDGPIGSCQRPLRAQTAQGERIALANSESISDAVIEIEIRCLSDDHDKVVREWLDYGVLRGIGQWRNSGKGRFTWEEIKD